MTVGKLLDTFVEGLLAAWGLFLILQALKRVERQPQPPGPRQP